jgi:hypothetical protein
MSTIPFKKIAPETTHMVFRKALEKAIGTEGKDLDAAVILAILSHMVGQVVAMQDQRKYTSEMVMTLVAQNIEQGNQEMVDSLMSGGTGVMQ